MAGYSVELCLKAKVCERFYIPNLFNEERAGVKKEGEFNGISELRKLVKTHNLELLLVISGLKNKFVTEKSKLANIELSMANSALFTSWDENARYKPCGFYAPEIVERVLKVVKYLIIWIREN